MTQESAIVQQQLNLYKTVLSVSAAGTQGTVNQLVVLSDPGFVDGDYHEFQYLDRPQLNNADIMVAVRFPLGLSSSDKEDIFKKIDKAINTDMSCDLVSAMQKWASGFSFNHSGNGFPTELETRAAVQTQIQATNTSGCIECGVRVLDNKEFYIYKTVIDQNGNKVVIRICIIEHQLNVTGASGGGLPNGPLIYSVNNGEVVRVVLLLRITLDSVKTLG